MTRFFDDWQYASDPAESLYTARRASDESSYCRAGTPADLEEIITRYELPFVIAAESTRAAEASRQIEELRTFGDTVAGARVSVPDRLKALGIDPADAPVVEVVTPDAQEEVTVF